MCLIAYAPSGAKIPRESVVNGFQDNNDGFGVMWREHVHAPIQTIRGIAPDVQDILDELNQIPKGAEHALHLRFATHGKVTPDLCHPFKLRKNAYVMHNGVLPEFAALATDTESDTALFAKALKPMFYGSSIPFEFPKFQTAVNRAIGQHSKLVFMVRGAPIQISNAHLGVTDGGIWYSNHGFRESWSARYTYKPSKLADWESDIDVLRAALSRGDYAAIEDFVHDSPIEAAELLADLLGVTRGQWWKE